MKSTISSISLSRLPIASPALFLGGLLWVAAFWLPVFETQERTITGYWVFVTGWMGFAMFQFAWYANLLMLMAVIMMYSAPLRATLLAALGLLVATQAFWLEVLPGTSSSTEITGQGIGFWVWYGSIFLLGLGVVFGSDELPPDEAEVDDHTADAQDSVQDGLTAVDEAVNTTGTVNNFADAQSSPGATQYQSGVISNDVVDAVIEPKPVVDAESESSEVGKKTVPKP